VCSSSVYLAGSSVKSRWTGVGLTGCGGFGGGRYAAFDGGGGIKGLRTNDVGFGMAFGFSGASAVLLKAAIRSRNDDTFSDLDWGVS